MENTATVPAWPDPLAACTCVERYACVPEGSTVKHGNPILPLTPPEYPVNRGCPLFPSTARREIVRPASAATYRYRGLASTVAALVTVWPLTAAVTGVLPAPTDVTSPVELTFAT
jgi:hypothetical protein